MGNPARGGRCGATLCNDATSTWDATTEGHREVRRSGEATVTLPAHARHTHGHIVQAEGFADGHKIPRRARRFPREPTRPGGSEVGMMRALTTAEIRDLARQLRILLSETDSGEFAATAATRYRLEGAVTALEVACGRTGLEVLEGLTQVGR